MNNYFFKLTSANVPGFEIGALFFLALFFSSCHNEQKELGDDSYGYRYVSTYCLACHGEYVGYKAPSWKELSSVDSVVLKRKIVDFQQDSVHAIIRGRHAYGPKEIHSIYLYLQRLAAQERH